MFYPNYVFQFQMPSTKENYKECIYKSESRDKHDNIMFRRKMFMNYPRQILYYFTRP